MTQATSERLIDILLVEDNPGDVRLTEEAFKEGRIHNDLHVVTRGTEALDYLHQRGEYQGVARPDLVLLDLNLPGMSGMDILEEIKASDVLKRIPVIILTSSSAEEDIVQSYEKHANAYLTKPPNPDEFMALVRSNTDYWFQMVELPTDAD